MLKFLLSMLGKNIYDSCDLVSDIYEILGIISVSCSMREKILDFDENFFSSVVSQYFSNANILFLKSIFFFLANFACEPDTRDIVTNQLSYFSWFKLYTNIPEILQNKEIVVEYMRFMGNLLCTD